MAATEPSAHSALAHTAALYDLARLETDDLESALRTFATRDAQTLGVARVGVWLFQPDEGALRCISLYRDPEYEPHPHLQLLARDAPRYFEAISESRALDADDAWTDPRTRELTRSYLRPNGITSLLDVPIWRHGEIAGVLCHEHVGPRRVWSPEEQQFASNVADLIARALEMDARRRLEAERRALLQELARERDLLDEVLRQMPSGVILTDAEGRIIMVNATAERTLGARFPPDTPLRELHPPATNGAGPCPWSQLPHARALALGETVVAEELTLRRDDGTKVDVSMNAGPILDHAGNVLAVVSAFDDISERKRIEAALAEEASIRERFVAILGHDLRTPLTSVRVAAHLLRQAVEPGPREAALIDRISRSADRMNRLIGDLLDFTRIRQQGQIPLRVQDADLQEICDAAVDEIRGAWPDRRVELNAPAGDYRGRWDADRISQVVTNLLSNALQHGKPGGPISMRLRPEPDEVVLEVHNLGPPLSPEVLHGLFKPFRTVKSGKGLGLGLFISRSIVQGHGGELSISNSPPGGITVRARLPRRPEAEAPSAPAPRDEREAPSPNG